MTGDELFGGFPELETERFRLRQPSLDDAADLFRIFSNEEATRYWSHPPYTSIDQAAAFLEKAARSFERGDGVEWAIVPKGEARVVGRCCFHRWSKEHFRGEIGYVLARDWWGRGVMAEALPAVVDFGFRAMKLHSVEAQIHPDNAASIRVVERLGFRKEGHLRENFCVAGVFSDTAVYSLLESDWRGRAEG